LDEKHILCHVRSPAIVSQATALGAPQAKSWE
jgi:hypothetical protein